MLSGLMKKIFGDKNTKAMNEIWPIVDEINAEYEKIKDLTDDELRAKTDEFKAKISEDSAEIRDKIDELSSQLTADDFDGDRHAIYDDLEDLNEQLDMQYEKTLDELLPEAFAVVKDTCRRLVGTSHTAAGNKVEWNMIPYDVQLVGGIVLHHGQIAEMATGEGKTLAATLPIYLNALTGRGVHIVSVKSIELFFSSIAK